MIKEKITGTQGRDNIGIATNFLNEHYTLAEYLKVFAGPHITGSLSGQYRPRYSVDVKVTAWYIESLGESNE